MILSKDEMIRFILTRKYFLKQYKIAPSKWRKRMADELVRTQRTGNADLFSQTWEYLVKEGVL